MKDSNGIDFLIYTEVLMMLNSEQEGERNNFVFLANG